MARKRSPLADIPADDEIEQASIDGSDDEEELHDSNPENDVEDDEEEEAEASEEDEAPVEPNESSIQKQLSFDGSESSDKKSGSDSDSESEKSSPVAVKPIRSKPMKDSSVKRPIESKQNDKSPRKKARVSNGDVEKKSANYRLWSEEDEIGILQGLIDYQLEKKEDPYSDLEAFHEFVKDSLHVNVAMKQLTDKIRRLKKKYMDNAEKGDVVFVKPHDDKLFELSKKIWGGVDNGSKVKARRKKDKESREVVINGNGKDDVVKEAGAESEDDEEEEDEGMDLKAKYPYLSKAWESDVVCSQSLKAFTFQHFRSLGSEKMSDIEKEWKDICVKELKLYVKKLDLKMKLAQEVLGRMTDSDP